MDFTAFPFPPFSFIMTRDYPLDMVIHYRFLDFVGGTTKIAEIWCGGTVGSDNFLTG